MRIMKLDVESYVPSRAENDATNGTAMKHVPDELTQRVTTNECKSFVNLGSYTHQI